MFTYLSSLLLTSSCKVIELEFIEMSVSLLLWCQFEAEWKIFSEGVVKKYWINYYAHLIFSLNNSLLRVLQFSCNQPGLERFCFG